MRASASQTRSALAAVFIIRAGLAGAVLSLVGCAGQPPAVGMYTRSGIVPLYTLAEPPPPAYSMPPGMQAAQAAAPMPAAGFDGLYKGTASVLITGGGQCLQSHRVADFRVRSNQAFYNGFRGKIEPDGSVQMHFGNDWIIGQFDANGFSGQLTEDKWKRPPGCAWLLRLTRVGP